MHGCDDTEVLAPSGQPNGQRAGGGRAERSNAGGPMVAGGPLHGGGMADSPESSAGGRTRQDPAAPDMAGMGTPGGGADRCQGETGTQSRLAAMGGSPRDTGSTVHAEGQAPVVGTPVSMGGVLDLLERQRYRCALSGRSLTPDMAALDHVMPIRFGGEHVIENTQVLHKDVNRAKGSLTRAEFIDLCREVVWWSRRSEDSGEEARS